MHESAQASIVEYMKQGMPFNEAVQQVEAVLHTRLPDIVIDTARREMDLRELFLNDDSVCPVCGAHKANYLEAMGRPCHEEHGRLNNDIPDKVNQITRYDNGR